MIIGELSQILSQMYVALLNLFPKIATSLIIQPLNFCRVYAWSKYQ